MQPPNRPYQGNSVIFSQCPVRLGMQIAFGRVRRKTAPTGVGVVIPFLKVYIALTAPERTDSQSLLQGGTDSQSLLQGGTDSQFMLQFQSEMV